MHIPSYDDLREVEDTVYNLTHEVAELLKRIEQLEQKVSTLQMFSP